MIESLARHPSLRELPIGLLDCGIAAENLAWFEDRGVQVRTAEWNIDFPQLAEWQAKLAGYKILIARPFLPGYFPEFDVFVWLDSDLWVQTPEAIENFLKAAETSPFNAVLEYDRNYTPYRSGPTWWRFFHRLNKRFFGAQIADALYHRPNINAGVFCMRRDAPHWRAWQNILTSALQKPHPIDKSSILVEQAALNVAVYAGNLPMACLPATHNWSCLQAIPAWNEQSRQLVEPHPPHAPISILHMTGPTKDKAFDLPVIDGGGRTVATELTYRAVRRNFFSDDA